MWVGIAVVLLVSGELTSGVAMFDTEAECRVANQEVLARIKTAEQVQSYSLDCRLADKFLTKK
jgi:hypothetical protein